MKTKKYVVGAILLFILLVVPYQTAGAETKIDNNSFPDSHLQMLANNLDVNKDGVLSDIEANALSELNINWTRYSREKLNLNGLEVFTGLKYLSIANSDVTAFDFEKLPACLNFLEINNCNLASFKTKGLSGLETLNIINTDAIAIDLSGCNAVKSIQLNQIKIRVINKKRR